MGRRGGCVCSRAVTWGSHQVCGYLGHGAPFSLEEVDVGHEVLPLQAVASVDEPIGVGIDIGVVDLREVSDEDHLAPSAHAGDESFRFMRGELLRLVDDEDRAGDGSTADMGYGFDLKQTGLDQRLVGASRFGSVA